MSFCSLNRVLAWILLKNFPTLFKLSRAFRLFDLLGVMVPVANAPPGGIGLLDEFLPASLEGVQDVVWEVVVHHPSVDDDDREVLPADVDRNQLVGVAEVEYPGCGNKNILSRVL